jgi:hypothetical protein
MAGNRITLELGGLPTEDGYVQFADFLGALQQFKSALSHADLVASPDGNPSAKLRVVELSISSPARIGVEIVPFDQASKAPSLIAHTIFAASRGELDPTASDAHRALVNAVSGIAAMVGKSLVTARFQNGSDQIALTPELRLEIQKELPKEYLVHGVIRGRLEFLNVHAGANNCRVYPLVGPRRLTCRFSAEKRAKIVASADKQVAVSGMLHYIEGSHFPHAIDVLDIEVLPPDSELPKLSEMRGIAPDATGDLTSEQFVRRLRDAWQD